MESTLKSISLSELTTPFLDIVSTQYLDDHALFLEYEAQRAPSVDALEAHICLLLCCFKSLLVNRAFLCASNAFAAIMDRTDPAVLRDAFARRWFVILTSASGPELTWEQLESDARSLYAHDEALLARALSRVQRVRHLGTTVYAVRLPLGPVGERFVTRMEQVLERCKPDDLATRIRMPHALRETFQAEAAMADLRQIQQAIKQDPDLIRRARQIIYERLGLLDSTRDGQGVLQSGSVLSSAQRLGKALADVAYHGNIPEAEGFATVYGHYNDAYARFFFGPSAELPRIQVRPTHNIALPTRLSQLMTRVSALDAIVSPAADPSTATDAGDAAGVVLEILNKRMSALGVGRNSVEWSLQETGDACKIFSLSIGALGAMKGLRVEVVRTQGELSPRDGALLGFRHAVQVTEAGHVG